MSSDTATATSTENTKTPAVRFSVAGFQAGFLECLPVALGVAGYGLVFGMLAQQAGLSVAEAALMSATVLAGAAQLIVIELWTAPIPVVAILVTTLIVNLRYVLMGAALRPWFGQLSAPKAYGSVFFTADENWALTMGQLKSGRQQGAFLLGSGLAIWVFWVLATVAGALLGRGIVNPGQYGLDFVLTAVFLAIGVELWEGQSNLLPWASAMGMAIVSAHFFPGRWYILLGAATGCGVEVLRSAE